MKGKLIERWEQKFLYTSVVIIFISILIEWHLNFLIVDKPILISVITGLASGYIATIFVLVFERAHVRDQLHKKYTPIEGFYKRIDMGQDNTKDKGLDHMKKENIDLTIELTYVGEHNFTFIADYWKSDGAQTVGMIEFDSKNISSAKGKYRYNSGRFKGHFGDYRIERDLEKNELVVFYQHLFPRKTEDNPDDNRGWEVWKWIKKGAAD